MKKFLSFALVLGMVLGGVAPAFATPADDAVTNLNEMGIVEGYADGSFGLDKNITRAEFAATVVKMLGLQDLAMNSNYTSQFTDVTEGWYVGYVNVAAGKGIINGIGDGTFRPQQEVSYAEAATMIVRYLEEDVDGGVWPANYLAKAAELGILDNAPATNDVKGPATRATVFVMANNALKAGEANKPVVSKVKALVVENSRVESVDDDTVIVEVMDDYTRADMEEEDRATFNGLKAGAQFAYKVKKNEDPEMLLGKVVYLGFTGAEVTSVQVSDEYKYLSGDLDEIDDDSLEVDGDKYTVEKEDRFGDEEDRDRRFYQAYLNGEDIAYNKFDNEEDYSFARVTVKNGKVLFIDAYDFEDIAPIEDVDGKLNMTVYEDDRAARTKKYDLEDDFDAEDLIKAVVDEDGKVELYRIAAEDIKADQVAHFSTDNDQLIVREDAKFDGEYDKVKTKKIDGDKETIIFYGDREDEVRIDSDKLDAIYSYDGKDFEELTDNFDDELEDFEGRDVEVLVDVFGKVQLIRSDFKDPRFFAIVTKALADKFDAVGKDNEEVKYEADTKTDLYEVRLDELDEKDNEDLYNVEDEADDNDAIDEIGENDRDNEDLDDLLDANELVYLEVDEDDEVDSLVKINIKKALFTTETFKDSFVRMNEDKDDERDYEIDGNTKIFFIGNDGDDDDVKAYESVEDFLDKYEVKDGQAATLAVVPSEDDADLAEVIVVTEATEEGDDTDTKVVKVVSIDAKGKSKHIEFEDEDGKTEEYELEEDSDAYDLVDDGKVAKDDIIEIEYYEEGDHDITDIELFIAEEDEVNYRVYKVMEVKDSGRFELAYLTEAQREAIKDFEDAKDDDDLDDIFDDLDEDEYTTYEARVDSDAARFGDVDGDGFVMVHLNKYDRVDAITEVEGDDALDYFAKEDPKGNGGEEPTPGDEEYDVTIEVTNKLLSIVKITDVEGDVVAKYSVKGIDKIKDVDDAKGIAVNATEIEITFYDKDEKELDKVTVEAEANKTKTFEETVTVEA